MRDNQPVTDRESVLPVGQLPVSSADARRMIPLANQASVSISGYARQELPGQPHGPVRHPDQLAGSSQTVAASVSEMSASIRIAAQASTLARAGGSREAMAKLSKTAQEITAVAKPTADIAEQTDLLALNATIEAARAGIAGTDAGLEKAVARFKSGSAG